QAKITVSSSKSSTAVSGTCPQCDDLYLGFLEIDGNRPNLGWVDSKKGGGALMEFGGDNSGQTIEYVRAYEPRGWSILHAREGSKTSGNPSCNFMKIRNNVFGPSGVSPNEGIQFVPTEVNPVGNITYNGNSSIVRRADGISLACANSEVYDNYIVDATDGGIVIFGAPGSKILRNTIISQTRNLLGGINMVDFAPYNGNYTDVVVENNSIQTDGAMMKIGIAMGTLAMVWGSKNTSSFRNYNGLVRNNQFSSSKEGYFGYGIALSGYNNTRVISNVFHPSAKFDGVVTSSCIDGPAAPPIPHNLTHDSATTHKVETQPTTSSDNLMFLICIGPVGADQGLGSNLTATKDFAAVNLTATPNLNRITHDLSNGIRNNTRVYRRPRRGTIQLTIKLDSA
ncbi:hypothetical protein BY996DRAFT_4576092, partial [Phakopsora pachyrhizi]